MIRRLVGAALAALVAIGVLSAVSSAPAFAGAALNGGGSGFAALEIDQWRADTARSPYNLSINYVSQGSSFGRQSFIDGNLDFGASDITFQPSEKPSLQAKRCGGKPLASCFVYVPVSAGGLALMYNLTDQAGNQIRDLRLTRKAACGIFTGAIKQWNDPQIVATNPRLASFNRPITPVIRADGAGESFVLSEFCIAVAPQVWQAFIADRVANDPANVASDFRAGLPVSNWPQNWGHVNPALYADGVANIVADPVTGKNAITYVAAGYAKVRNNFPVASLQNAAGFFTQPDEANVTLALAYATGNGDGTFKLNFNGSSKDAYFPSTYSYVIAQTTGFPLAKGQTLATFLCYSVGQGQVIAPQLRYARLSKQLVDISVAAIMQIPGAPKSRDACVPPTVPPPPPPPPCSDCAPPPTVPGGPTTTAPPSGGPTVPGQTTTTIPGQKPGKKPGGPSDTGPGATDASGQPLDNVTSTTSLDDAIQASARQAQPAPKRDQTPWLVAAGMGAAFLASLALRRRREGSS